MVIAFVLFTVLFLALAIFAFMGKLNFVISSNKKDSEGNSIYDEAAISKYLGVVLLLLMGTAVLGLIGYILSSVAILIISPILLILIFLGAYLISGSGRRFLKRKRGRRYRH